MDPEAEYRVLDVSSKRGGQSCIIIYSYVYYMQVRDQ